MSTYYRLAQIENTLPKHWAYCDSWEFVDGQWVDNRVKGFQVFGFAYQVFQAAIGMDMDGIYGAKDYPQILEIEVEEEYVSDGCSMFFAIDPDGVVAVKGISTQVIIDAVKALYGAEKEEYDYDSVESWAEDSDKQIAETIAAKAITIEVKYIETLPFPCVELEVA